jgi:hypothetical protein
VAEGKVWRKTTTAFYCCCAAFAKVTCHRHHQRELCRLARRNIARRDLLSHIADTLVAVEEQSAGLEIFQRAIEVLTTA